MATIEATDKIVINATEGMENAITVSKIYKDSAQYTPVTGDVVTALIKEWPTSSAGETFTCTHTNGAISFTISEAKSTPAGIYFGEFCVKSSLGVTKAKIPFYLNIERSLSGGTEYYPLVVSDVRNELFDRVSSENIILQGLEYPSEVICDNIIKCVNIWNISDPPINLTYTQITFPYKDELLRGVVGGCMLQICNSLLRNQYPINSGGVAFDDKKRLEPYLQIGKELLERYKMWVLDRKYSININGLWGSAKNGDFGV